MSKILFDKKRKKRIIHIAEHAKRQRLRKNTLFLKCLHLNCDSQLYILSHPSIHKNPLPGGFLCFIQVFMALPRLSPWESLFNCIFHAKGPHLADAGWGPLAVYT